MRCFSPQSADCGYDFACKVGSKRLAEAAWLHRRKLCVAEPPVNLQQLWYRDMQCAKSGQDLVKGDGRFDGELSACYRPYGRIGWN